MRLREQFIDQSNRAMDFGALPVSPKRSETPIIPVDRWLEHNGSLCKTYRFRRTHDRDSFVMQLLAYEAAAKHNAEILINEDKVSLRLRTRDVNMTTELDKEYARYADVLFKDLVYSHSHGDEGQ